VAICSLHCRHGCCNDVTMHLRQRLLLLLPRSLFFAEHLVRMCYDIVVLFTSDVLALEEVVVVALILVKLDELLVGLVDLVSCGPYPFQGFVDCASSTLSCDIIVQGNCLHKHVPDEDKLNVVSLGRGVEARQLLCLCFFIHCGGRDACCQQCGCCGALGGPGSHFSLALWFKRRCPLSSLCTC
jgi:hypothetical protein